MITITSNHNFIPKNIQLKHLNYFGASWKIETLLEHRSKFQRAYLKFCPSEFDSCKTSRRVVCYPPHNSIPRIKQPAAEQHAILYSPARQRRLHTITTHTSGVTRAIQSFGRVYTHALLVALAHSTYTARIYRHPREESECVSSGRRVPRACAWQRHESGTTCFWTRACAGGDQRRV